MKNKFHLISNDIRNALDSFTSVLVTMTCCSGFFISVAMSITHTIVMLLFKCSLQRMAMFTLQNVLVFQGEICMQ